MNLQYRCISLVLGCTFLMSFFPMIAHGNTIEVRILQSNIEGYSESMVDAALARDAVTSHKLYKNIQKNMDTLHQLLTATPFDERNSRELIIAYSWMRIITVDIKEKAWTGAAIAANQLSASMIRFLNYPSLVQRDTAWLGFLAHEVILLNMESAKLNAQLLQARIIDLSETWSRIRRSILDKDFRNKTLVEQGDQSMHLLHAEKDIEAKIATAKVLLEIVDEIEKIQ